MTGPLHFQFKPTVVALLSVFILAAKTSKTGIKDTIKEDSSSCDLSTPASVLPHLDMQVDSLRSLSSFVI